MQRGLITTTFALAGITVVCLGSLGVAYLCDYLIDKARAENLDSASPAGRQTSDSG